jgi:hypothetical protein
MAVTVYLKNGSPVRVGTAVSINRGSFLPAPPEGAYVGESVELQDDQQRVIASFLLSEIAGYVIGTEASLEDIAAAARATASSVVGAARRRGAAQPSSD